MHWCSRRESGSPKGVHAAGGGPVGRSDPRPQEWLEGCQHGDGVGQ